MPIGLYSENVVRQWCLGWAVALRVRGGHWQAKTCQSQTCFEAGKESLRCSEEDSLQAQILLKDKRLYFEKVIFKFGYLVINRE